MLKKDKEFKWSAEARDSFEKIKKALIEAPVLISLSFAKEFSIFSFASEDTIVVVLLQNNSNALKQPISSLSKTLRDSELKYSTMEKQPYALVKALELFRIYVLHSKIMVYVPNIIVKEMLVKPDSERKRVTWIAKIMEYDVDINPTKLVKGQGL